MVSINFIKGKNIYNKAKTVGKKCLRDKIGITKDEFASSQAKEGIESLQENATQIGKINILKKIYEEINSVLPLVKDEHILEYINSELNSGKKVGLKKLKEIKGIIDSVNSANGYYCVLQDGHSKSNIKKYVDYLKETGNTKTLQGTIISKELEIEEKFFSMKKFIINNPQHEMSDYLYKNYYIKYLKDASQKENIKAELLNQSSLFDKKEENILPEIIDTIEKINEKFGTKIFLGSSYTIDRQVDCKKAMDFIYNELSDWQEVSNGKANLSKIIDLSKIKKDFAAGTAAGYYNNTQKSISIDSIEKIEYTLRHELIHANEDSIRGFISFIPTIYIGFFESLIKKIAPGKNRNKITFFDRIRNIKEFQKGGISLEQARYGFKNSSEYMAVAGEGDTRKYSKSFKRLLNILGMPKYVFKLKPQIRKNIGIDTEMIDLLKEKTYKSVDTTIFS